MLDSARPLARNSRTSRAASVTSIACMRRLPHYLAWIDLLEQEDLEDAAAAREGMVRAARGWLEVHGDEERERRYFDYWLHEYHGLARGT